MPAAVHVVPFPAQQNTIMIGGVGITPNASNYFPLVLGNAILGGLPLSSILFDVVRNQHGYAYGISSHFVPLRDRGPFYIQLQTRTHEAQAATLLTQQLCRRFLKEGPTSAELKAAQDHMIGGFPLKISTNSGILANITEIGFYHRPLDFLSTYMDRMRQVTPEAVKQAMQTILSEKYLSTVMVGQQPRALSH